jgi:putative lipoprotein
VTVTSVRCPIFFAVLVVVSAAMPRVAQADSWLGPDKALHFGVSAGLAGGAYGVGSLVLEPRWARIAAGASVSLAAGAAKELYDLAGYGNPSWKDFAWDVLGTAFGIGVALLVDYAVTGAGHRERVDGINPVLRF